MNGKLYFQNNDGEYQELRAVEKVEIEEDAFTKAVRSGWDAKDTFMITPIYKEWYKKKKGKRYVWYYKIRQGIDPKIIEKLLKGDKNDTEL